MTRESDRKPGASVPCAILVSAALLACSALQPPADTMARADQTIAQASAAGAADHAALEIELAREKLAAAERAVRDDDLAEAHRLAEQSLAEAQLAQAKTDAAAAERNQRETRDSVWTLADETQRTTDALEDAVGGTK